MLNYRPDLKPKARRLRSAMTDAENFLWRRLRGKQIHGVQFYRQKPLGSYIVDFYAPVARLVIEVDGSQHLEPNALARDKQRDLYLNSQGLKVLRFDDRQVLLEGDAVLEVVEQVLRQIPPDPPFFKGGRSAEAKELSGSPLFSKVGEVPKQKG